MGITGFIAGRLRFRGGMAAVSIAVSFLVMIIAVSVSSGFRKEIRDVLAESAGDIRIVPTNLDWGSGNTPIERHPSYLPYVDSVPGVASVSPVVYRAGIVRKDDIVHGVLFKGTEDRQEGQPPLTVSIPERLSSILGAGQGDTCSAYFVGDRVKARKFTVGSVYDDIAEADDRLVVYAGISDLQRIDGWTEDQVSAFEIILERNYRSENIMSAVSSEVGAALLAHSSDDEAPVLSLSTADENPQLFDWLSLIDFNVLFIIALMTVVAGFNMISGLLILLFENISRIGILKSLGMTDSSIVKVFLRASSKIVLKGMLAGNAAAFLFCIVQGKTRFLTLDPENYFISYVPVQMEPLKILAADAAAYLVIMLLLLLPSLFISRVDPAKTVKAD